MSISSQNVKARGAILSYRRGGARQYNSQVLIKVFIERKNIGSLVGSKVIARDRYGNIYRGKVLKVHSYRNSIAIVKFKPNIPGQLLGSLVEIL